MELLQQRLAHGADSTLSALFIDNAFACYLIEDEPRDVKVRGETRVPAGRYQIKLRTEGGLHGKYALRFPEFHEGMLWLQDVPDFQWVYFHCGNTEAHTDGCPLMNMGFSRTPDGEFVGSGSVNAYSMFYPRIAAAVRAGDVWVTVRDE